MLGDLVDHLKDKNYQGQTRNLFQAGREVTSLEMINANPD